MTPARLVFAAFSILVAVILQVTLLSRLGVPGATPDLVLVVVMAFGSVRGPLVGACLGFAGGILLDLAPPAIGYFGTSALLLALAGYIAGIVAERSGGVVVIALITVALVAAAMIVGRAALGTLLGDPRVLLSEVPVLAVTDAVYAVLMAALVMPAVAAIDRVLEPRSTF